MSVTEPAFEVTIDDSQSPELPDLSTSPPLDVVPTPMSTEDASRSHSPDVASLRWLFFHE